jgi:O-acetyl-ADP-ribose deacetylase (regulator of RNase III)
VTPRIVEGDLLDQPVEAVVNAWNRNILPWWLLIPQGVSGAIKRRAGTAPFRELARRGLIPLGEAVLTSAGKLPYKGIIHVAGIDLLWRSSERSIRLCVRSAMRVAAAERFASVAFPVVGGGTGSFDRAAALSFMLDEFARVETAAAVTVVKFRPRSVPGEI